MKLKPCPFCGSEQVNIILEHDRECGRCWYVQCLNCYARGSSMVESVGNQRPDEAYKQIVAATHDAVAAWNKRASEEQPV